MELTSSAFMNNSRIPKKYTCEGDDINPPLKINDIPRNTQSLILIMDDPDSPGKIWAHWIVYNIPPSTTEIKENSIPPGSKQARNSWKKNSYNGPCPKSGEHRYFFKLYALDTIPSLDLVAEKDDVEKELEGHTITKAELIGLYQRKN